MQKLISLLILFAAVLVSSAAGTNYFCVVCGKGPLTGHIWISKWGAICDDCYQLPNHCSICGLPIRDGDGAVKTGDGRLICRFDKTNAVLDLDEAREVFTDARRELVELFGSGFALNYPDVTLNLFDVDYWSENGRADGLHKFGFASTRRTANGDCTHEVVMLSGRLRPEIAATAAHEYTHLWINENRPPSHAIASDTIEGICELSAYQLMAARGQTEQMEKILANPYTHGEIKKLVALERENGMAYILNWVKNGRAETLENAGALTALPARAPISAAPPVLPAGLKFSGVMVFGNHLQAVINGVTFAADEEKQLKLKDKIVRVRCQKIDSSQVVVKLNDSATTLTLRRDEEILLP